MVNNEYCVLLLLYDSLNDVGEESWGLIPLCSHASPSPQLQKEVCKIEKQRPVRVTVPRTVKFILMFSTMISWFRGLLRPFLLASIVFFSFNIFNFCHRIYLTAQGITYLLFCNDKKWPKPADPLVTFAPLLSDCPKNNPKIHRKTIVFVRHGESTWNDTFNKGSHRTALQFAVAFLPGILTSLAHEYYLTLRGRIDSWFYDSPLSKLGLNQVNELAKFLRQDPMTRPDLNEDERLLVGILRGDPNAPRSKIVCSSLRRALSTMVSAFRERLGRTKESIVVLPSLQEISRNPDTLSITPVGKTVEASWIDQASSIPFQSFFTNQLDMRYHLGNKAIDTNGLKRMNEFCHVAFTETLPEQYIIVGGHSIWFRSFFRTFLPYENCHISKKNKLVNAGCVAFDLLKTDINGEEKFMIDDKSMRIIYGGFK